MFIGLQKRNTATNHIARIKGSMAVSQWRVSRQKFSGYVDLATIETDNCFAAKNARLWACVAAPLYGDVCTVMFYTAFEYKVSTSIYLDQSQAWLVCL